MKVQRRRSTRLIAGMLAGAVALSVSPLLGLQSAGAADPLPPLADPTKSGAFCDGAPTTNPFTDLGAESAATRQVILCLVATELTSGTSATTFTPGGTVTRRQMALFIKRLADLLEGLESTKPGFDPLPVYDNVPDYTDVAAEGPAFREAIGQLSQAEIVGGFSDNTFRPGLPVSRRQMAAFVNRLQNFLSGAPFTTTKDFFDDDNGDSGEKDLNALASVGVFQGNGQGKVFPGASLTRRQMANILLRDAQVYLGLGAINRPFAPEPAGGSLAVTPTDLQTLEHNGTRDFTVTKVDTAEKYDIALFACANVITDSQGFSFKAQGDSSPNNTKADRGAPTAALTKVNGANTANGDGVTPTAGSTITFTVTSSATQCVRPVVFQDTSDDDTLAINPSTKRATEPFGVGGETQFRPAEAQAGPPIAGQVSLVGPQYAVLTPANATVFFRNNDTYRLVGAESTLSGPDFFQRLSTGDRLGTCNVAPAPPVPGTGGYSRTGSNVFCLDDSAPSSPGGATSKAGTPADTVVDLSWTAATPADAYNIYRNEESCSNTTVPELKKAGTVAANKTTFSATGLTPATTYCFVITTVEQGDESTVTVGSATENGSTDNTTQAETSATLKAPTITSARLTGDPGAGVLSTGDTIVLVFSEPMNAATVSGSTFSVSDADNGSAKDLSTITCGASTVPDNGVTSATCSLNGAGNTLTITIAEAGDDSNAGGGNNGLQYPLLITATSGLKDANNGLGIDLPNSLDQLINA